METLMVCGYFATGLLTEANTIAAAILYAQEPREIYLTTGRINTPKPKVAHVVKGRLLNLGVDSRHIKVKAQSKDSVQEVKSYDGMLTDDQNRNFLANLAQHPRLWKILRREEIKPVGEVLSTQEVLDCDRQYDLLDELRRSDQQQWYEMQETQVMRAIEKQPLTYEILKILGRVPFKGDLQYISYLLFSRVN